MTTFARRTRRRKAPTPDASVAVAQRSLGSDPVFGSLFAMLLDAACLANEQTKAHPHADGTLSFGRAKRGRMLNATPRFQ
jgi:hypothetical protein